MKNGASLPHWSNSPLYTFEFIPVQLLAVLIQSIFFSDVSFSTLERLSCDGALIPLDSHSSNSYSKSKVKNRSASSGEALCLNFIALSKGIRG